MSLFLLDFTHGRATSGLACLSTPWTTYTVGQCRSWITSYPLDITHGRTTSGMTCHHIPWTTHGQTKSSMSCHHRPWTAYKDGQCKTWRAIMVLGLHKGSDDVGSGIKSCHLESTYNSTTLGVVCHHISLIAHIIEQCRVWPAIITFGNHSGSDDVRSGMPA